jgi:CRISPR-associated protein Cmr5
MTPQPTLHPAAQQPTTSQQRTLEQKRAAAAWERVRWVRDNGRSGDSKSYAKEYGQLARSAPADIQVNGLGQTLAFWRAKGSKDGRPKDNGQNAHWQLQEHVSAWVLARLAPKYNGGLLDWIIAADTKTDDYRRATAEAVAFLVWLKRFAEAELGGE